MQIYFIGAGSGDPELMTIKGKKIIEKAEVIIYAGSLVNPEILSFSSEKADIYNSAKMNLEEVIKVMEKAVKEDRVVARIHTGDPSIYGAIQEQIDILNDKNIDYKIIPGVSSFLAAAAAVEKEFTLPEVSQTVILTRQEGRTSVPEKEKLEKLASHQASMAIFLSVQMIDKVVDNLLKEYKDDTPAAVVAKASWPDQKVIKGKLQNIAAKVKKAGIKKTAMILVGDFLGSDYSKSKLYDKNFSHGYRQGKEKKKAILVVSFGTSYHETRKKTIKACENRIDRKFSGYDIKRAFTSGMIINILSKRDGIEINNPEEALKELYHDGYQEVLVQPLHIINGSEFHGLVRTVNQYKDYFNDLKMSRALLRDTEDYFELASVFEKETPDLKENEAVVMMGHGSEHPANSSYPCLDYVFKDKGLKNYYVGTVEGYPELDDIISYLKKDGISKVYLLPLMLVAGDHAQNDMAGDEDSWKNTLEKEGFEVEIELKGMGEYEGIQNMYLKKIADLLS